MDEALWGCGLGICQDAGALDLARFQRGRSDAIDTDANTPIVGPKVIIIRWRRMTKEDVTVSLDRNVDLAIRRRREPYVVVQVESRISGAISGGGRIGEEVRLTQHPAADRFTDCFEHANEEGEPPSTESH